MKKVYQICNVEYKRVKVLCYVSTKAKAFEYIKSCLGVLTDENKPFVATNKETKLYYSSSSSYVYDVKEAKKALTKKELLNWYYDAKHTEEFGSYYVEEIEVF